MYLFDALFFFLVRPSFCPHGLVGWRPPELLPSPPPSGWSTGFITTPRLWGRLPSQRLRPALPIDAFSWSRLPTWPIVARHSMLMSRISLDGIFTDAWAPSLATSCTDDPADRAIWPPLPGFSSTLWSIVPS